MKMKAQTLSTTPSVNGARPSLTSLVQLFLRAFPHLSAVEQRLARTLYQMLAEGHAVAREQLAQALGITREHVQRTLDAWPGIFYDEAQRIIGFLGLAIPPMNHRLTLHGKTVHAWCAWDTLFLPELLGATVQVTSSCALSGEPVHLTVSPTAIETVEPATVVMSFIEPDEQSLRENVTVNFCHYVHFFRTRADGETWVAKHPGSYLLTLDEGFLLGKQLNAARYPQALP